MPRVSKAQSLRPNHGGAPPGLASLLRPAHAPARLTAAPYMSVVSRDRQVQAPLARRAFDNLGVGTALMLNPPTCNARLDRPHQAFAILGPLLVQDNFFSGRPPEVLTMNAQSRFLASPDETRQLVHPPVLRSTVEGGVIDASIACCVLSHRAKMDAPIRCKTRIFRAFCHCMPCLPVLLRARRRRRGKPEAY